jgi:hypothetical protein
VSHKDNMDLRNTGDGGWFYAEHELFSVFAPLIGPLGVSVYMAMCRLIPLAAVDPDRPVTERSVMDAACVGKGTVGRKMSEIVALGMVEETRHSSRRPSTFKLVSLRKLALVGIAELQRRIGAPVGGTEDEGESVVPPTEGVEEAANAASPRGETSQVALQGGLHAATSPAASGKSGAPQWGTDRPSVETTLVDLLVPQKQASVPQKTASVPQNRGSLFKEEEFKELNTPLPPKGGQLSSLTANADADVLPSPQISSADRVAAGLPPDTVVRPPRNGKNQKPSRDGPGAGGAYDPAMDKAVAWLKRECVLAGSRTEAAIRRAMRLEGEKTDAPPDYDRIAARMAKSYAEFLANQHLMAYKIGPPRFFDDMWDDQRKWPWDEKRLREGRRL